MNFNLLALATLAAAALQVSAQIFKGPTTFGWEGSGCPRTVASPSLSIFSNWVNYTTPRSFAAAGGGTANCDIEVNTCITDGFRFRFARALTPVTVANTPNSNQSVENGYYFPGRNNSVTSTGKTVYLTSGDFTSTNAYTPDGNWSICGGCFPFKILTTISAPEGGSITTNAGSVDTAVIWEAC